MREVDPRRDDDTERTPRVSVIIIFLNAKKFIEEAIESVRAQTHQDWEVLLVDDGSTDGSTELAVRYVARCRGKFRYLHHAGHKNLGMSAARNLGLRNARGQYIALLDADDVWFPHKLERQVGILDAEPTAGMVYGATEYWYSWTGRPEDVRRDTIRDLGVRGDELIAPPRLLTLFLEGRAVTPCPSDIVVRRSVIEGVGGFEESFRGLYEDQVFCAKVCLQVPVFVSTECWDRYRQHAESCTSMATNTRRREVARLVYLNWLEGFLAKTGVEAPEVWQALRDKRSRSRSSGANSLVTRMWRVGRVAFKRGFRA